MPEKAGNEWYWKGRTFESQDYIGQKYMGYPSGGGIFMVGKIDLFPGFPHDVSSYMKSLEQDEMEEEIEYLDKQLRTRGERSLLLIHPEDRNLSLFVPCYIGIADNFDEDITTRHPKFDSFQICSCNSVLTHSMPRKGRKKVQKELVKLFAPSCNDED